MIKRTDLHRDISKVSHFNQTILLINFTQVFFNIDIGICLFLLEETKKKKNPITFQNHSLSFFLSLICINSECDQKKEIVRKIIIESIWRKNIRVDQRGMKKSQSKQGEIQTKGYVKRIRAVNG